MFSETFLSFFRNINYYFNLKKKQQKKKNGDSIDLHFTHRDVSDLFLAYTPPLPFKFPSRIFLDLRYFCFILHTRVHLIFYVSVDFFFESVVNKMNCVV